MEMNTRLQVEHPVTELVYGADLVELQLRLAAGEPLPYGQEDLQPVGHAVEARVYAEDARHGFLPTGGRIVALREPAGPGIRVDSGIRTGGTVGSHYDPMLAKVIAHGADRATAIHRLDAALGQYAILGLTTNVGHLRGLLADPDVIAGRLDTGLVERLGASPGPEGPEPAVFATAALFALEGRDTTSPWSLSTGWRHGGVAPTTLRLFEGVDTPTPVVARSCGTHWEVSVGDDRPLRVALQRSGSSVLCDFDGHAMTFEVAEDAGVTWIAAGGSAWAIRNSPSGRSSRSGAVVGAGPVLSPMPGVLLALHVALGDNVERGQAVAIVEAMKMEHTLTAAGPGRVVTIDAAPGDQLQMHQLVLTVETMSAEKRSNET
jgi:acetyl-CoA/propionyl-CoA carboxylase biotin carboxyl carrier protein